jgi:hypothetical protein
MNNQNWQLSEGDQFAPAAPDTLEHLPSHHCATVPEIDPRFAAAHYGHDLKPMDDIKSMLRIKTPNVWALMATAEKAADHIAMLESEAEQLRMAWKNARIDIDGLMDIVRSLCCLADSAKQPNNEGYASLALCDDSPLMIAARQACIDHGFTDGGLAIEPMKDKSQ